MCEKDRFHLGAALYLTYEGTLEDFIEWAAEEDFEYVEIKVEPPHLPLQTPKRHLLKIKSILSSFGIKPIVHAPFYDINIASLNPYIRKASFLAIKKAIDIADTLSAEIVVVHAGALSKDFPSFYINEARENAMNVLKKLLCIGREKNIKIGIENKQKGKDRELLIYPQEFKDWLNELGEGAFAVLDLGHAYTVGLDPSSCIKETKDILSHIHLHDNKGERDEHLPLGEGSIPYIKCFEDEECLRVLNKKIPLILELTEIEAFKKSLSFLKSLTPPFLHQGDEEIDVSSCYIQG